MTKNKLLIFLCAPIFLVCFALSFAFSNLGGALALSNIDNYGATAASEQLEGVRVTDNGAYIDGELYTYDETKAENRKFDRQRLKNLLSLVLGEEFKNIDQLKEAEEKSSNGMAQNTYGKDGKTVPISVKFCGFYWNVVYFSKDINGDPILTLWLDGGVQEYWLGMDYKDGGDYYGFNDRIMYSDWSPSSTGTAAPSNMYGTSYIRAVTLNNGGQYYLGNELKTASKSSTNTFFRLTMPLKNGNESSSTVNRFLVQPKDVSWQTAGQSAITKLGKTNDLPNENCVSDDESSFANDMDYTAKENYYAWAEDYLWLPSLSEVGSDESHPGLWEVSAYQKQNGSVASVAVTDRGKSVHLGVSNNDTTGYNGTWLRSGEYNWASESYYIQYNGANAYTDTVSKTYAVRPAIHLNLVKAIKDAGLDRIEININGSSDYGFYKYNVHQVYDALAGKKDATYKEILDLAKSTLTSEEIAEKEYNKGQYLSIKLGGLVWDVVYLSTNNDGDPILTLWLNSNRNNYSIYPQGDYSDGSFQYGTMHTEWSAGWADIGNGTLDYPSNMYGTSYIRAVPFNNGGSYADGSGNQSAENATLIEYAQQTSYTFAKFTMPTVSGSFTKFLEQPKNIPWQMKGQSAKTILGLEYDLPNENCVSDDESSFASGMDYTAKENYYAWADDYLWLPSLSEVGYDEAHKGLWETTTYQRYNNLGCDEKIEGDAWKCDFSDYGYDYSPLRSGSENNSSKVYCLNASGNGASTIEVYEGCALRPALHLNLKEVAINVNDLYLLEEENIYLNGSSSDVYDYYTGSEITVWVQYGSSSNGRLTEGEDYTITYEDNINAGEATCTITGINDYTGVVTMHFTIRPAELNKDNLELVLPESLVYTGDPINVGIKYTPFNKVLVEGEDYTIEYDEDNINAGMVNCIVTGKGNYEGEVRSYNNKLSFRIEKKELEESMLKGAKKYYVFNGDDVEFEFTLEYNGKTLKAGTDYKYEFYNNGHVNDAAQLRIEVPEYYYNSNFKGSFTYYFEIIEPGTEPETDPDPAPGPSDSGNTDSKPKSSVNVAAIIVPVVIVISGGIAGVVVYFIKKKKK